MVGGKEMITGIKNRCPGAIQRIHDQYCREKQRHPEMFEPQPIPPDVLLEIKKSLTKKVKKCKPEK
jgi:hypothetical protein